MKRRLKKAHGEYLKGKMDGVGLDRRVQSYLGVLSHANQHTLSQAIRNAYGTRKGGQEKKGTRVSLKSTPKKSASCQGPKKNKKIQEPFPKAK